MGGRRIYCSKPHVNRDEKDKVSLPKYVLLQTLQNLDKSDTFHFAIFLKQDCWMNRFFASHACSPCARYSSTSPCYICLSGIRSVLTCA